MIKLIKILQVGGFALALVGLFHKYPEAIFITGFTIHFIGDMLFLRKEGL